MALTVDDVIRLRTGVPPDNLELIKDMTLGSDIWLDKFSQIYLDTFISAGGSKVKVLIGNEGSGKTHMLRAIEQLSLQKGYSSIYLSARNAGPKLNDIPNLYRLIISCVDMEKVICGLSVKVAQSLGYGSTIYDGTSKLLPYIIEEGYGTADASREIRIAIAKTLKDSDFSPSLFTFAFTLIKDRLINDDENATILAIKWIKGEKLERFERQSVGIFETLQKSNARQWLNSLLKLIIFSGMKGLIVLIDDIDVMYERSTETGRFIYSPSNIKDTCELIRQIIDDAEMLKGLMFMVAGRRNIVEDEKRGFKSYEALWMRLQTGLVPSGMFNSLCDIVDIDKHLESLGPDFPGILSKHLFTVFSNYGLKRKFVDNLPDFSGQSTLKAVVMENAYMSDNMEADNHE